MNAELRRDLDLVSVPGSRTSIVVDEIAGRFARVTRNVWRSLHQKTASRETLILAQSAGWMKQRESTTADDRIHLLSFRVRLFSIDRWARLCLPVSGAFFSTTAVCIWLVALVTTLIAIVVRWDQLAGGLPSLATFVGSLHPLAMAIVFVFTKAVHELGHAVLCRRLGSRCGTLGVWFFMGFPCPFVDVSDVWRQPTPIRRAAVMAAGIWMEWIVAMIASWVWMVSPDATIRLFSLHVMLVCGVSTVLFNCNPLMRYDGYFILSDMIDTANLREEARSAWRKILAQPLRRWGAIGRPVWMRAGYHVAATIYRIILTLTIAGILLAWSAPWGAWRLVCAAILAIGLVRLVKSFSRWSVAKRCTAIVSFAVVFLIGWVPFPRRYPCEGMIRVRGASEVFLPSGGLVRQVDCAIGQRVITGQVLAIVDDADLRLKWAEAKGQFSVWEQKTRSARRASLISNETTVNRSASDGVDWPLMQAALAATEATVGQLDQRMQKCQVVAPVDGVVLAPLPDRPSDTASSLGDGSFAKAFDLKPGVGEPSNALEPWCRIGSKPIIEFVMQVDVADTSWMEVGRAVRVSLPIAGNLVYWTTIESISPPSSTTSKHSQMDWDRDRRWVTVHCVVHDERLTLDDLPSIDGASGDAIIEGPRRTFGSEMTNWVRQVLGT